MSDSKPEYLKQLLICLILIKPYHFSHFEPITDVSKYSVKACKEIKRAEVPVSFGLIAWAIGEN